MTSDSTPLLTHPLDAPSAFRPEDLMEAVLIAAARGGCTAHYRPDLGGPRGSSLPLPSIVVVDEAIRDEGTSLHCVSASTTIGGPSPLLSEHLARELEALSPVRRGLVWTTDAPYRETEHQLRSWAMSGALAVEMQAASLFAFARAKGAPVGVVALVSNSVDHAGEQFDTGGHVYRLDVLAAVTRAARTFLGS